MEKSSDEGKLVKIVSLHVKENQPFLNSKNSKLKNTLFYHQSNFFKKSWVNPKPTLRNNKGTSFF